MFGIRETVGQELADLFAGPVGVGQDDDAPLFIGTADLFQRVRLQIETICRNHIDVDVAGTDAGDIGPAFDDEDFLNHERLLPGVRQCTGLR